MMCVVGTDAVRIDDVGVAAVEMDNVGADVLVNYTIGRVVAQFLNPAMKYYHIVGK